MNYTDGVAVHWYESDFVPDGVLQSARTDKKDVYLIQTESCKGDDKNFSYFYNNNLKNYLLIKGYLAAVHLEQPVELGNWNRAADYAKQILSVSFTKNQ